MHKLGGVVKKVRGPNALGRVPQSTDFLNDLAFRRGEAFGYPLPHGPVLQKPSTGTKAALADSAPEAQNPVPRWIIHARKSAQLSRACAPVLCGSQLRAHNRQEHH